MLKQQNIRKFSAILLRGFKERICSSVRLFPSAARDCIYLRYLTLLVLVAACDLPTVRFALQNVRASPVHCIKARGPFRDEFDA